MFQKKTRRRWPREWRGGWQRAGLVGELERGYASGRSGKGETAMKKIAGWMAGVVMAGLLAAGEICARQAAAVAQQPPANAQEMAKLGTIPNPVSAAVKGMQPRYEKNMVAAAEAMPAEKYGFKPSPEMNSYGHL